MGLAWWSVLPFAAMLLAIAVLPLVPRVGGWWERRSSQILVAAVLGVPVAVWMLVSGRADLVGERVVEYGQFIVLLLSLFVVAGGVRLEGDLRATPRTNTLFLAVGGVLASLVGTTGAAMLLVRAVLATNAERARRAHTVVFLIFIVANCGGLLTPLGDPPLFLGFLAGVPFTWTLGLAPEWLFVNGLLLLSYYGLDRLEYAREDLTAIAADVHTRAPLRLRGTGSLAAFAVIILAVALLPSLDLDAIAHGTAGLLDYVPLREIVMLAAAFGSYRWGSHEVRFTGNRFTWAPISEVAVLFAGIFLTMIPALQFLRETAAHLDLGTVSLFTMTGLLSSVLDNAPTYITFFTIAQDLPGGMGMSSVAGVPGPFLAAISLGAVLCGALTYIGNGPNLMVATVARAEGVAVPSFGGYILKAGVELVPVLVALVLVFLADSDTGRSVGIVIAAGVLARAEWRRRRAVRLEAGYGERESEE